MGIVSEEKSSRKRKRNKSVGESPDQSGDTKDEKIPQNDVDLLSPEQKSAKKRKKSKVNNSLSEDSPKSKVKKSKAADDVEDDTKKKGKIRGKKRRISTEEQNREEDKVEKDDTTDTSILSEKIKSKEKKRKSSPVKTHQTTEETVGKNELSSGKKKKKKGGSVSSFGVVDSKLLKESGGDSADINATERSEGEPSRINRAVDYLHSWKTDKKLWKFNKNFQSLLIKAIYNPVIISEDDFETCLLYFEECQGVARDKLRNDAMALVNDDDHLAEPVDADMERRARGILQMLG